MFVFRVDVRVSCSCFVFRVSCFVFCVLCFVFCVLCFVFCVLCFVFRVSCSCRDLFVWRNSCSCRVRVTCFVFVLVLKTNLNTTLASSSYHMYDLIKFIRLLHYALE